MTKTIKIATYLLTILLPLTSIAQPKPNDDFKLSISPAVDKTKKENQEILLVLENFLQTKNESLTENKYWLQSDFDRYTYPYLDINQIERSRHGQNYFKPSLMELITINENEKLLKVAFIGVSPETEERFIRCIYNIVAVKNQTGWKLKRATDYQTKDWTEFTEESILYKLPKGKEANQSEIEQQAKDIQQMCMFFETEPIAITYYSCFNPQQVYEVKGFDYLPNMFFDKTGGMADFGNIVYSGNNSEYYTHEIVHIYTQQLFKNIHKLLDEGIATYIGGSGKQPYTWHRQKMKEYLNNTEINLAEHLQPYERLYIDDKTSIPYLIGALICERTLRLYGKDKLFALLNTGTNLWSKLNEVGLTKENLTVELQKELKLDPTLYTE